MTPILLAGLELEPLSLDEMRVYLRLGTSEEDALVFPLIKTARNSVEQGGETGPGCAEMGHPSGAFSTRGTGQTLRSDSVVMLVDGLVRS